jgi:poly(A) polymerase
LDIPPSKPWVFKKLIKDAILDGHIENNYDAAYDFMIERAKEMGIQPKTLKILNRKS